ncbi:MAG: AraC family transcriptional regulator [Bacteroidota bacterium]
MTTTALAAAVERYAQAHGGDGHHEPAIDGLHILRRTESDVPIHLVHKAALCVVVQGAKQTTAGETTHVYRTGQALVATVEVPAVSVVTEASPEAPYLSVILELDPATVADVLESLASPPVADSRRSAAQRAGLFVIDIDEALADCVLRAIRLLDTPDAVGLLYPAVEREVCYRLLAGPHGAEVAAVAVGDKRSTNVVRAVRVLRDRFAEPVRLEALAEVAHLSPSAFHRRFKALTSMTPLQYQKRVRLIEARRLMLTDAVTAEAAAHEVGYASASHFSREYAREFGAPPRQDVEEQRRAALALASA